MMMMGDEAGRGGRRGRRSFVVCLPLRWSSTCLPPVLSSALLPLPPCLALERYRKEEKRPSLSSNSQPQKAMKFETSFGQVKKKKKNLKNPLAALGIIQQIS